MHAVIDPVPDTDCIVVGAGAIGLAIARELSASGREVVVLERASQVGTETSSRSNEVIHAGIYHRSSGPQAVLCTRGREALYAYCEAHGVPHRQIGKLVVATDEDSVAWLEDMHRQGRANGVPGLELLDRRRAALLEPNLRCAAALFSPRTGIVDTHQLMLAYRGDAEANGAVVALRTAFVRARRTGGGFEIEATSAAGERTRIRCTILVNAAGIWASDVARHVEGMPAERVPKIHLAKGAFFTLRGAAPFRHLIVPEPKSWRQGGIFTLDLAMRGRFGPDEQWVDSVDYGLEGWPIEPVYAIVRRYFPALPDGSLSLDYSGIRPRLNGPGTPGADWLFQGEHEHGIAGLVNLFGFESPGITASLEIAKAVSGMLEGQPLPFDVDPSRYGTYRPPEHVARQLAS